MNGGRRGLVVGMVALVGVLGGARAVHRFWTHELYHVTGKAEWVWMTDSLERLHPVAGIFVGSIKLDSQPAGALLKVCGDREYVVYVNGTAAACGWSRPGFRLDLYDIAHLLKRGENAIAVEVRSPTPAGGLLLALDVEDVGRDVLVSGPDLRSRSHFDLGTPTPGDQAVPVRWGAPPRFPWGYPELLSHARTLDQAVLEDPVKVAGEQAESVGRGGYRFVMPRRVHGYLWIEWDAASSACIASGRSAGALDEGQAREQCQPAIRLPGQMRWLDPEPKEIEEVFVFGRSRPRSVEVWPLAELVSSIAPGVVPGTHALVPRTRWTTRNPPG